MGLGENMLLPMGEKSAPPTIGDITLGDMNSAHSVDRSLSSLLLAYKNLTHSIARHTTSTHGEALQIYLAPFDFKQASRSSA